MLPHIRPKMLPKLKPHLIAPAPILVLRSIDLSTIVAGVHVSVNAPSIIHARIYAS